MYPDSTLNGEQIRSRALSALRQTLTTASPKVLLDGRGYTSSYADNLLPSVIISDFDADLRQGSGDELTVKFRALNSSSALAVNGFGPFRRHLSDLRLCGADGMTTLHFEKKCPIGIRGTPPNLDVLVEGANSVIAIESKFTEYLTPHPAGFSPSYETGIRDERRETGWFREMLRLIEAPRTYRWLDAAQLVKHALGLLHCYPGRRSTLLYLYWEPLNAVDYPLFEEHRGDISTFAERITGPQLGFEAMTYNELWASWDDGAPQWLSTHLRDLRARYAVTV